MTQDADRQMTCITCGASFVFTDGEQRFFAKQGFTELPKRCVDCRSKRKASVQGSGTGRAAADAAHIDQGERHLATCSRCNKETYIPFKPSAGRPVFCRDCFKESKRN